MSSRLNGTLVYSYCKILPTCIAKNRLKLACKPDFNLFFAIIALNVMRYIVESGCMQIYSLNVHVIIFLCFLFPH